MIAAPVIDITSEARWRNQSEVDLMPQPEETGTTEQAAIVGEEAGSAGTGGGLPEETGQKRSKEEPYGKSPLPSYLGQKVDIYV